jgi:DNA-binding MarR family transcriptional regulator
MASPIATVNSDTMAEVNRPVSPQGLAILRILAGAKPRTVRCREHINIYPAGVEMQELFAALAPFTVSRNVARASISRTLRRLWALGLVELHHHPWACADTSLSAKQREARRRLAEAEADPEGVYQGYVAWIARKWHDRYGSAAAFVEAKRKQASRPERGYYVRFIEITDKGRQRLTFSPAQKLTGLERIA